MTQTVSAVAVLGPGLTGLALGYRVLNLDTTVYSAFTVVGVAETAVLGTYQVSNGVVVPAAGGYIVFGTALVDYALAPVDARGLVQADILSDATPFAGANIDAAISTRAEPGDAMTLTGAERTAIDTELSTAHGAGSWETATGFAVAGDEMDLVDAPNATALAALAEAVWTWAGAAGRTLTSLGSAVVDVALAVWRYARRRLTMTPTEIAQLGKPGSWTLYRGVTWREQVTLDEDLTTFGVDGDALWFTYKSEPEIETDAEALLQVSFAEGLLRLNGATVAAGDADQASLTLVAGEEADGLIELYVSELATTQLDLMQRGYFDVTLLRGGDPYNKRIVVDGLLQVRREVTRAVR